MHIFAPLALLTLAAIPSAQHEEEPPHPVRDPFSIPGLPATVEQFSLSSDRFLDAIAMRMGGANRRILAVLNDGRGLEDNWSSAVVISDNTSVARSMNDTSCQVFGDKAFVAWLDDRDGAGATRVHFNRYDQGASSWLGAALEINDSTYPSGSDVTDFRMVVRRGTSGSTYVVVLASLTASGQERVFLSVSSNAGTTFAAPVDVSSGTPGDIDGLSCDLRLGELHLAWVDDRGGSAEVFYRRAILNFFGTPTFLAPERAITGAPGTDVVGKIVLQANAENAWSGTDQKLIGVAYRRENDDDATTDLHVVSSRDNGTTFADVLIDQTANGDTEVSDFDFEIPGDTFALVWADDSDGTSQLYRGDSDDGTVFADPVRASGFEDPSNEGLQPKISPSFATPDGACLAFIERGTGGGREVHTNFSDQAFGGAWHDEEFPRVSAPLNEPPVRDVLDPDISYNQLYYNYIVGWREETSPGSGIYGLTVGGYRPPFVHLEIGPNWVRFPNFHIPFQDTFGFVMVSLAPPTTGTGTVLHDGRATGLVADALTTQWLTTHWRFAIFENLSAEEGGETAPYFVPPTITGFDITFLSAAWGPTGELRTLTEPVRATIPPIRIPHVSVR
jgi:hypothetical protein